MNRLFLIAGPCVIENEKIPFEIGQSLKTICDDLGIDLIYDSGIVVSRSLCAGGFMGSDVVSFHQSLEDAHGAIQLAARVQPKHAPLV